MYHKSMTKEEEKFRSDQSPNWEERITAPKDNYERWIDRHNHKLELVRTVGSVIAAITGLLVFLKVFNLI